MVMAGVEMLQIKKAADAAFWWNRRAKFRLALSPLLRASGKRLPVH